MKKWILLQLTEVSAWVGFIIIIATFIAPREYIAILGALLIIVDDDILKNWVAKISPKLAAKIEELSK